MSEKYAHPTSPAGFRRLKRLKEYADFLDKKLQHSNLNSDRIQAKISALRWAVRMLEDRFPEKRVQEISAPAGPVPEAHAQGVDRG